MSDIRPLGSERLQGMDKIKRILEISAYNEKKPVSISESSTSEYVLNLSDGNQYQIVKEKNGYIIKKTINESETEYIDRIENRKFYKSYSQALRRLNLMAKEVNNLTDNVYGTELFTEQKKYVLKTPKPESDTPPPSDVPAPATDVPAIPTPEMGVGSPSPEAAAEPELGPELGAEDMGTEDMGAEDMGAEDMGGEDAADEEVSLKSIQKLVGKLAQKLRTISKKEEEIDSKDIKYVVNSVLSAVDLNKLEDEDKEEILGRFESDEELKDTGDDIELPDTDVEDIDDEPQIDAPEPPKEEGGEIGEEDHGSLGEKFKRGVNLAYGKGLASATPISTDHPLSSELEETEINAVESILDELFTESKVDKLLSKYFVLTESEKKDIKSKKKNIFSEIKRLSESVNQELISKKVVNRFPTVKLIGKTNKQNLVFEHKNKQFKVTASGKII